jgi:chromosome segregation ATPase
MKHTPFIAFVFLPLLLPPALSAEEPSPDFASINNNLDTLETLILDTLTNNEELTKQLADLRANLNERERLLTEREALIVRQENSLTTLRQLRYAGGVGSSSVSDAAENRPPPNLQGAVGLIREIRSQLKVLEDFYASGQSVGGAP